eukprot:TRINITY_DN55033_c0_g1_i1.p1 TRINITY_DN55033_c0_g1~~TRINITY_DN55033_c0_g1_i1.p1  ORF type:complete len:319 (+),score=30.81 TRINITY_DN55033_c0_g1_i1:45-1001(+)
MSDRAFKRLKASEEDTRLTWRGDSLFSDWTLTWGDDLTFRVHRVILAGGSRPAHFFSGATNSGFEANSTDLSKVLPLACKEVVEIALDFIYGAELAAKPEELPLLYKLAEMLQCPTLQNTAVDSMMEASKDKDRVQFLVNAVVQAQDERLMDAILPFVSYNELKVLAPKLVEVFPQIAVGCIRQLAETAEDDCFVEVSAKDVAMQAETVQAVLKIVGTYRLYGTCKGQPSYKKIGGAHNAENGYIDVFIYHWPKYVAGTFYTWWIGSRIGANKVFAGNVKSGSPPIDGWNVPFDSANNVVKLTRRCLSKGRCPHVLEN